MIAYAPAMGVVDWFRRLFSPSPAVDDDPATQRAEYGEGGLSGLARLEDARARESAPEADQPRSDAAP